MRKLSVIMCLLMMIGIPLSNVQATPPHTVYELVSYEAMQPHIEALTAIEPYSGWRNAGTVGEQEATDYIEAQLADLSFLTEAGMTVEQQAFPIYATQEIWDAQLEVVVGGTSISVPAESPRGDLNHADKLLQFDTDGALNDSDPNPLTISQPVVLVQTLDEFTQAFNGTDLSETILLLNYELLDPAVTPTLDVTAVVSQLLTTPPAAVVLLTANNVDLHLSHGTNIAEAKALIEADSIGTLPRLLFARMEDFGTTDLSSIESATVTLDIDVISPAESQNLVLMIPGENHDKAVIVGANVDSMNTPGAVDNASGAVGLLEMARVLDAGSMLPPYDLYLVWFGAEGSGFYGSANFATQHQDLLDRTVAMIDLDGLTALSAGVKGSYDLMTWTHTRMGFYQSPFANAIKSLTDAQEEVGVVVRDLFTVWSSNTTFNSFGVPNVAITYHNLLNMSNTGSFPHGAHINSPYDTLAQVDGAALEEMVRLALLAVLEASTSQENFISTPAPEYQVVVVANHTQADVMASVTMVEFAMTLSSLGYDMDVLPYGSEITAEALVDAEMVIALPAYDYGDSDEAGYTEAEVTLLDEYVAGGGFLVLTNTTKGIRYDNTAGEDNEDYLGMNVLGAPFGVTFVGDAGNFEEYTLLSDSPLFDNISFLDVGDDSGVSFTVGEDGIALIGTSPADLLIGGVLHGEGSVMVLGDYSFLGNRVFTPGERPYQNSNFPFWQNFARIPLK